MTGSPTHAAHYLRMLGRRSSSQAVLWTLSTARAWGPGHPAQRAAVHVPGTDRVFTALVAPAAADAQSVPCAAWLGPFRPP